MSMIIAQFGSFSQAQMIFLSFITLTTLYAGIKIQSLVAVISWSFLAIALVGVMEFNLDMIYFWFMLMVTAVAISIGLGVRTFYATKI